MFLIKKILSDSVSQTMEVSKKLNDSITKRPKTAKAKISKPRSTGNVFI